MGPSAELLELLGDKTAARRLAQKAGVPVIPGTEEPVTDAEAARKIADEIGFPLIVKAAFGGGGRGMRIVESEARIRGQDCGSPAGSRGGVRQRRGLPRALYPARKAHRSADPRRQHGNILHLYERDCSVQRRHQKVVEVAPAVQS